MCMPDKVFMVLFFFTFSKFSTTTHEAISWSNTETKILVKKIRFLECLHVLSGVCVYVCVCGFVFVRTFLEYLYL